MKYRLRPSFCGYENNCLSTTVDPFVPEFAAVKARLEAGTRVSHIDADYDRGKYALLESVINVAISLTWMEIFPCSE
ncbi:hypothetical protein CEXT_687151 [Caerostris extrusa]|uniref:Uncharacterized protein n=1 Tax=Caerostris extrusa TaxID=172846 RepID=A0AAV4NC81_CAEEX|nr:hypothetical protein CEXT_687151 [Caerostris extrusa]